MKRAHVGKDNRQIGDAEAADLDLIDKVPAAHDSVARDAYDLYGAQRLDLPLVCQCAEQSEVADTPVRSGIQYDVDRSEEHTSELQSLMRISYGVFCLQNKNKSRPINFTHDAFINIT